MGQNSKRLRVVLVTNMVAPYRVSFYNALAQQCDLVVITDAETEFNRKWKLDSSKFLFDHVVLHSLSVVLPRIRKDLGYREHRQMHFSEKLFARLVSLKPDVVVSNELGLRSLWCMLYANFFRCPWVLTSEATNHTEGWVGSAKRLLRSFLISQADVFWSNGKETNQFLTDRGASFDRIISDMTGIATEEFYQQCKQEYQKREVFRQQMGLSGVVFLFVGRLESGKGIAQLMEAIQQRHKDLKNRCSFLFVGSGSMLESTKVLAREIDIPFHFQGFVQPEELSQFFAAGDVFIMPTLDDNWPLVNLEALAAGLPQLYSVYNGGMLDLNSVAGIGDAIDPHDVVLLGERLVDCVLGSVERISPEQSFSVLQHYSPESQAQRAMESFRKAIVYNESE
jgi:glycosyltransferase involved in cell wall biosynthesis